MLSLTYLPMILELAVGNGVFASILQTAFPLLPLAVAIVVRLITKKKSSLKLSLKLWRAPWAWLFSAFVPGIAVALGAVAYFLVFKEDYRGALALGEFIGNDSVIAISNPFVFVLVCLIIAAVLFPYQLFELGEEYGWRGYLLSHQIEKYGVKRAVLLNGFEWGLVHMPIIYLTYREYAGEMGAPWSNMAAMLLVCTAMGIIFSYVTVKTGNMMYAAIMHGVVNIVGEIPVYCSVSLRSGIFGPNPSGIITMSGLIILAAVLFVLLCKNGKKKEKQN